MRRCRWYSLAVFILHIVAEVPRSPARRVHPAAKRLYCRAQFDIGSPHWRRLDRRRRCQHDFRPTFLAGDDARAVQRSRRGGGCRQLYLWRRRSASSLSSDDTGDSACVPATFGIQLFGRDALAVGTVLAAPPVRGLAPVVAEMCCAITYDAAILGFMVLPPTPEYEQFSRREIDRPLIEPSHL